MLIRWILLTFSEGLPLKLRNASILSDLVYRVFIGKVKILEDATVPAIPSDSFFCNYKRKPNYLSSAMAHKNWCIANYRFGSGSRISADPFPKSCCKVFFDNLYCYRNDLPSWIASHLHLPCCSFCLVMLVFMPQMHN